MEEVEVLEDQLEELLEEGAVDPEDALEIALVAGLVARLAPRSEVLAEAEVWRQGPGRDLLAAAWAEIDHDGILEEFDAQTDGTTSEDEIEEAVMDIDELLAAAAWCGKGGTVMRIARHVADSVSLMPELFTFLAEDAAELIRMESVGREYTLYAFWFALAQSEA